MIKLQGKKQNKKTQNLLEVLKRMKKSIQTMFIALAAFFITFMSMIPSPITISAAEVQIEAKSAILVDANTGKILFEKEADLALPPASMTKMMTEYLVLEAIEEGVISWTDTTRLSDYAYSLSANSGFSGYFLRQDRDYTVEQLYSAMAVNSDNATSVALAELVAGSEDNFVKMMNEKAQELGLPDAQFVNSTGLANSDLGGNHPPSTSADADNYLSAKSAALLAFHLINDFSTEDGSPLALEYSSLESYEMEGQTSDNWNEMLPGYERHGFEGMDGLKTGYTDMAGYCFTGTAEQNGRRLISVVMKTDSEDARFEETRKLLEYGFNQFEQKEIFPAGYQVEDLKTIPVNKGKEKEVAVATNEAITSVVPKGEEITFTPSYKIDDSLLNKDGELTAPLKKGDVVGTLTYEYSGDQYSYIDEQFADQASVELVVQDDVEKANWFTLIFRAIGDFFVDLFTSVVGWFKGLF